MMNLGFGEIIFILVALLLFIGPKKLPGLAKGLGKGMKEFNEALRGITSTDTPPPAAAPEVPTNDTQNQEQTGAPEDHIAKEDDHRDFDIDHSDLHEPEVPHDHDEHHEELVEEKIAATSKDSNKKS